MFVKCRLLFSPLVVVVAFVVAGVRVVYMRSTVQSRRVCRTRLKRGVAEPEAKANYAQRVQNENWLKIHEASLAEYEIHNVVRTDKRP